VVVRGQISGIIRGVMVTLQSTSRVEGDIHHMYELKQLPAPLQKIGSS